MVRASRVNISREPLTPQGMICLHACVCINTQTFCNGCTGASLAEECLARWLHTHVQVACALAGNVRGWVHVDVFDGSHMCGGNLTVGPPVIASLRAAHPHAFLDVHLAVDVSGGKIA